MGGLRVTKTIELSLTHPANGWPLEAAVYQEPTDQIPGYHVAARPPEGPPHSLGYLRNCWNPRSKKVLFPVDLEPYLKELIEVWPTPWDAGDEYVPWEMDVGEVFKAGLTPAGAREVIVIYGNQMADIRQSEAPPIPPVAVTVTLKALFMGELAKAYPVNERGLNNLTQRVEGILQRALANIRDRKQVLEARNGVADRVQLEDLAVDEQIARAILGNIKVEITAP